MAYPGEDGGVLAENYDHVMAFVKESKEEVLEGASQWRNDEPLALGRHG